MFLMYSILNTIRRFPHFPNCVETRNGYSSISVRTVPDISLVPNGPMASRWPLFLHHFPRHFLHIHRTRGGPVSSIYSLIWFHILESRRVKNSVLSGKSNEMRITCRCTQHSESLRIVICSENIDFSSSPDSLESVVLNKPHMTDLYICTPDVFTDGVVIDI